MKIEKEEKYIEQEQQKNKKKVKKKEIKRILIANNGLAAVKFIRSIRQYQQKSFSEENIVKLIVLASTDDLDSCSEHIRLADQYIKIEGGASKKNYSNVDMIIKVAQEAKIDAVWPGWGHASENPTLPKRLKQKNINFIGPSSESMQVLGDKITSMVIAQSLEIPVISWSGSNVKLQRDEIQKEIINKTVEEEKSVSLIEKCNIKDQDKCVKICKQIGYPVMLKASQGGGGKGIRKVDGEEQIKQMYRQVKEEVAGSEIFAMQQQQKCRHIEVQIMGDMYGNVISLYTRDCSVQRRHQKLIEEGPVLRVPLEIQRKMEEDARKLGRVVKYAGVGTVEYLYNIIDERYYFLELNPRLQVEHPVTESITGVDIPVCMLLISMGYPLYRIDSIRRFYGQEVEEEIDFERQKPIEPKSYTIGCRITCEDTDEKFKPTCGRIEQLNTESIQDVWQYFNVRSGSNIHQYQDSQIGHVFSRGDNRSQAIKQLVACLKDIKIIGDIETNINYMVDIIESKDYQDGLIDTQWLDNRIQMQIKQTKPPWYQQVIAGAILKQIQYQNNVTFQMLKYIEYEKQPSQNLNIRIFQDNIKIENRIYQIEVRVVRPDSYQIVLNGSSVQVSIKKLGDGGILLHMNDSSYVMYSYQEKTGQKIMLNNKSFIITDEQIPQCLVAPSPGKIIKLLLKNGDRVQKDEAYAEFEVMKMIIPLVSKVEGIINFKVREKTVLNAGDQIAYIDISNTKQNENVYYQGIFPQCVGKIEINNLENEVDNVLNGYLSNIDGLVKRMKEKKIVQYTLEKFIKQEIYFQDILEKAKFSENYIEILKQDTSRKTILKIIHKESSYKHIKDFIQQVIDKFVEPGQFNNQLIQLQYLRNFRYKEIVEKVNDILEQNNKREFQKNFSRYLTSKLTQDQNQQKMTDSGSQYYTIRQYQHMNIEQKKIEEYILYTHENIEEILLGMMWDEKNYVKTAKNLINRLYFGFLIGDIGQVENLQNVLKWKFANVQVEQISIGIFLKIDIYSLQNIESVFEKCFDQDANTINLHVILEKSVQQNKLLDMIAKQQKEIYLQIYIKGLENRVGYYFDKKTDKFVKKQLLSNVFLPNYCYLECDEFPQNPQWIHYLLKSRFISYETLELTKNNQTLKRMFVQGIIRQFYSKNEIPKDINNINKDKIDIIQLGNNLSQAFSRLIQDLSQLCQGSYGSKEFSRPDIVDIFLAVPPIDLKNNQRKSEIAWDIFIVIQKIFDEKFLKDLNSCSTRSIVIKFILKRDDEAQIYWVKYNNPTGYERLNKSLILLEIFKGNDTGIKLIQKNIDKTIQNSGVSGCVEYSQMFSFLQPLQDITHNRLVTRRQKTNYCYDFLFIFESELRKVWRKYVVNLEKNKKVFGVQDVKIPQIPDTLISAKEYIVIDIKDKQNYIKEIRKKGQNAEGVPYSIDLCSCHQYQGYELLCVQRPYGQNTVGVILQKMQIHSPTCPMGQEIFVIANDISFMAGAFGVMEDITFLLGVQYALKMRYPIIYLAANSGAKFGIAKELIKFVKVQWNNDDNHQQGIKYLYFEQNDYIQIINLYGSDIVQVQEINVKDQTELGNAECREVLSSGCQDAINEFQSKQMEKRFIIEAVYGKEDGLGVECLSGSSSIASIYEKAFESGFTLTYVTGRSVGIGAYLSRLGRRCIQKIDTPIILTGYTALNKLLGKNVYNSNLELGGPKVMFQNGIAHQKVCDDQEGILNILEWIQFISMTSFQIHQRFNENSISVNLTDNQQKKKHFENRVTRMSSQTIEEHQNLVEFNKQQHMQIQCNFLDNADPENRLLTYPDDISKFNPMNIICGDNNNPGLFDKGTFIETYAGWAKTVITGRVRLGGIGVGVIAAKKNTVSFEPPLDPLLSFDRGMTDWQTQNNIVQQAGQVWYPDSSLKTANAIEEFNKEKLPLIVLANWRGFAGGKTDLYQGVLQNGSLIIKNLRNYQNPVFVYLYPGAELRGGAWVVLDSQINPRYIEMYADSQSKGGVLEPEAMVQIKLKENEKKMITQNIQIDHKIKNTVSSSLDNNQVQKTIDQQQDEFIKKRDVDGHMVGLCFAELHDKAARMKQKKIIKDIVPWQNAREFFCKRLQDKLYQLQQNLQQDTI